MTPREDEPKLPPEVEDEDEWYYSLGQRGAEKSDARFMGFGLAAIIGTVVAFSFFAVVLFLSGHWIYAFWLFLLLPLVVVVCIAFGGIIGVAIRAFIQRYFMRDSK